MAPPDEPTPTPVNEKSSKGNSPSQGRTTGQTQGTRPSNQGRGDKLTINDKPKKKGGCC